MNKSKINIYYYILTWIISICSHSTLHSQSANINFTNFNNEPNLYKNSVYAVKQDKWGYLWIGTYNGLYRYDGYQFKAYTETLKNHSIMAVTCLLVSSQGELWVGTRTEGVFVIDLKLLTIKQEITTFNIPFKNIIDIKEDIRGNIWISNEHYGLYKFNRKENNIKLYTIKKDNVVFNDITNILCSKKGNIYVSVFDDDIYEYNEKKDKFDKKIILEDGHPYIRDMFQDENNNLIINGYSYCISYNLNSNKATLIRGQYPILNKMSKTLTGGPIIVDRNKNVWFGTATSGLYIYNKNTKLLFNYKTDPEIASSIPSNTINTLFCDNCGNIWIGTQLGLSKLNYVQQHVSSYLYKTENSRFLSAPDVRAILVDSIENTWVGTINGGLNLIHKNGLIEKFYFNPKNSKNNNSINTIYPSRNSNLLLGTKKGLITFNTKSRKFDTSFSKGLNDYISKFYIDIWGIFEENDSLLWLGAKKLGLIKLNKKTQKYTFLKDLISSSNNNINLDVWTFYKARNNLLYIGTSEGLKIIHLNKGKLELLTVKLDSFSNINVFNIFENSDSHLWLATSDNGLYDYNPQNGLTRHFSTANGLSTNMICSVIEDENDDLWLSSVAGIMVLNPVSGKVMKSFDITDGLPENRFNFKSNYKTKRGKIYFGGVSGLFSFSPSELHTLQNNSSVIITSFKINYEERITQIKNDTSFSLPYHENNFSFDFAYLDFSNPAKNQFSYKLVGFKDKWENIGTRHSASFTNIDPGTYTLLIRASNRDTFWSPRILKINITISTPYWKTWWFYILVVCSSLGFIFYFFYLIFKRRDAKRKLAKSELSALRAQLNPHFIFNCMTSLQHFILANENDLALPYLNKFGRLMRMILENSEKESITIEQEVEFIHLYTFMESSRLDHKVNIEIILNENIRPNSIMIPPMLLQPIIENAFVHGLIGKAPGGKLTINFIKVDGVVSCSIIDNGIGREKAKSNKDKRINKDKSFGLKITNERLHLLGISYAKNIGLKIVDLKDVDDKALGTEVIVTIPIFEHKTN